MSNDIQHKDLFLSLGNIKRLDQWLRAGEKLGLRVCRGTKHPSTFRNPKMPKDTGRASLIAVIPNNLHKTMNQKIFKEILKFGIKEDDIWEALEMR
jgi:hypothetical protein